MTVARIPKCANFKRPLEVSLSAWLSWLQRVRRGTRNNTPADLMDYAKEHPTKYAPPTSDEPRLVPCPHATLALMGRKEFRAFVARIEAGRCDPRFVVGVDAIMWDSTRLAPTGAGK